MTPTDTILLVEADRAIADLIALALSQEPACQTVAAQSAGEASSLVAALHPKVVVLDLLLPQTSGLELIRQWQQAGRLEEMRVIVISALGYREIVQQAFQAGARDFIVKPFDLDVLARRVRQALAEARGISAGPVKT